MGQQQLLLVILVTIIVGIATVVAINVFGSAADNANIDAVRTDLLSLASSAQGYYMKPDMMGGGGQEFTDITFRGMGAVICDEINTAGTKCQNANGVYEITDINADDITVSATPTQAGGLITITIEEGDATMGDYNPDGSEIDPISE